MEQDFDLFGNPYHSAARSPGRPEHEPSQENIINIMVLLSQGMTNKEIAKIVGISVPTLRKHYLHLTKQRDVMLQRLKAKLRTAQIQQGLAGNAAALSAAIKMLDSVSAERVERDLRARAANGSAKKGYVSKKETKREAAQNVGGKFAPPPPPRLVASNGRPMDASDHDA